MLTYPISCHSHICQRQRYLWAEIHFIFVHCHLHHLLRCLQRFSDDRPTVSPLTTAFWRLYPATAYLRNSIIFRAFQGIGGGGCFSLCTIITIEIVPPERYTQYVTGISIAMALALLLGPIVGGAIAANTDWRWIFIIKYAHHVCAPYVILPLRLISGCLHHMRQCTDSSTSFCHRFICAPPRVPVSRPGEAPG